MLPSAHAPLPGDDDARNDAKSDLREDKPEPVDALVEHRIDHSEDAVEQTGPQDGCAETSQENWVARKHGKHCAVEEADDQRGDEVDSHGDAERIPVKGGDLRRGVSCREE